MSSINIRPINPSSTTDHDGVAAAINVAFVEGDSWFKKPECQDRCPDASTIVDILSTPTSTFLLAEDTNTNMILGALRVDWNDETKTGHFGMLGVPTSNAGQGIGKSKIRKVVRAVKKQAPKAIRASLALLDEFGSPATQDKVAKARRAAAIVKGAGPPPPGHKLRKLCN